MTPAVLKRLAEGKKVGSWYRRELPYSWDVLVENVTDPGECERGEKCGRGESGLVYVHME